MNKKGFWDQHEMVQMLFYSFMVVLVSMVIMIGFSFSMTESDTFRLEKSISEYRLFNSPDCFAYYDENGFFVKSVIDLEKFDKTILNDCFNYESGKVLGLKLTLRDFNKNSLKEITLNEILIDNRFSCLSGNDEFNCFNDRKFVLYAENDEIKKGYLDILVVGKNE